MCRARSDSLPNLSVVEHALKVGLKWAGNGQEMGWNWGGLGAAWVKIWAKFGLILGKVWVQFRSLQADNPKTTRKRPEIDPISTRI